MRISYSKSALLTLIASALFALACSAQTFDLDASRLPITQVDSTWRFHLGDDPQWSRPDVDDSHWPTLQPAQSWTEQGYPNSAEFAWFRFRIHVPANTTSVVFELPGIAKSYQLFSDGELIAQVGTLPPGPAYNVIGAARVFTLPVNSGGSAKDITIALCTWQDPTVAGTRNSSLDGPAYAGQSDAVLNQFAATKAVSLLAAGGEYSINLICLIICAAALLLFWLTRERFYLWFSCSLALEIGFMVVDLASAHQAWGFYFYTYFSIVIDLLSSAAFALFIVEALNPGKWKRAITPIAWLIISELSIILVLKSVISVKWGDIGYCVAGAAAHLVLAWYLIQGWRAGNLYAKLFFFPFAVDTAFLIYNNFTIVLMDLGISRSHLLFPTEILLLKQPFQINLQQSGRVISLLGLLAVLVYRFARTSREQQRLSSALKAAHDIQNRLVPVDIPVLGGLQTEIAYRAAEEVGGDFCQILPRPDGSIFIAIGDVSGKGLQAAMLGAVAVGALRSIADEMIAPAAALERLNHVLLRTESSGFITCLCLVLTPDGEITVANAGHLSPYLNGTEIPLEADLPLGVIDGLSYIQATFTLPPGARLTLLSDGVVEARSRTGELFGFDRTSQISQLPASEIASIAHEFGQEDDITVITLGWHAGALVTA